MKNHCKLIIPEYVISWTDKYFHQSAFDAPMFLPNKRIIKFLSIFKSSSPIKLCRGVNKNNFDNNGITSWTYNKKIAKNYISDGGEIIEKIFEPEKVLLDTTKLNPEQKKNLAMIIK